MRKVLIVGIGVFLYGCKTRTSNSGVDDLTKPGASLGAPVHYWPTTTTDSGSFVCRGICEDLSKKSNIKNSDLRGSCYLGLKAVPHKVIANDKTLDIWRNSLVENDPDASPNFDITEQVEKVLASKFRKENLVSSELAKYACLNEGTKRKFVTQDIKWDPVIFVNNMATKKTVEFKDIFGNKKKSVLIVCAEWSYPCLRLFKNIDYIKKSSENLCSIPVFITEQKQNSVYSSIVAEMKEFVDASFYDSAFIHDAESPSGKESIDSFDEIPGFILGEHKVKIDAYPTVVLMDRVKNRFQRLPVQMVNIVGRRGLHMSIKAFCYQ